jgi:hypothetical protein
VLLRGWRFVRKKSVCVCLPRQNVWCRVALLAWHGMAWMVYTRTGRRVRVIVYFLKDPKIAKNPIFAFDMRFEICVVAWHIGIAHGNGMAYMAIAMVWHMYVMCACACRVAR